jgi:CSLREA domain-containing protein
MNVLVRHILPARRLLLHALPLVALVLAPMASALAAPLPAATLTVNSLADPGDGTCDLSECTLREAIADATSGDTINFSVTGTINLTVGELLIEKDLTINGPGMNNLTIDGGYLSRVVHIYSHFDVDTMTSYPVAVDMSDLGIARGQDAITGGGLFVDDESWGHLSAVVNLTRVRVRDTAPGGGGIVNLELCPTSAC